MSRVCYGLLLIALVGFSGCNSKPPTGRECFQWATGLDLPEGVTCLNVKVITVAFVGDTYYLKLSSPNDLTTFFDEHFKPADWDSVEKTLTPPGDWKKDLAFWDETEIKGKDYYTKEYKDSSGTSFVSNISYDKASGVIFFVGEQLRE